MSDQEIMAALRAEVLKRVTAAVIEIANETRRTLSTPAPRRKVKSRDGSFHYVATTRATPGAPPRKLSGRLRASQGYEVDAATLTGRAGTNVIYGRRHEFQGHPWLVKSVQAIMPKLQVILGSDFDAKLGSD